MNCTHPLYEVLLEGPGVTVSMTAVDDLLSWGMTNSLWVFPMATSWCVIELMAAAASRVDIDRIGTIIRASPRQADVMVVAGTITTKMAPRVKKLWEQMPEPKWCIAMGSCAMSGDFYRNLYSVVPGIDTFMPVDVYIPGCPPNPEGLMHGLLRLKELVEARRRGFVARPVDLELMKTTDPSVARWHDPARPPELTHAQEAAAAVASEEQMGPALVSALPGEATPYAPLVAEDLDGLLTEVGVVDRPTDGPPLVPAARHVELARRLKVLGYRQFVSIVATHWKAGTGRKGADAGEPEHYEVAYLLRTVGLGSRLAMWAVRLGLEEPVLTLSGVFAGADWQEREQYELVGVRFAGHPDLRRLMMAENFVGHPLRKDFASDAPAAPWR